MEDEEIGLPADTLKILQDFLHEKEQRELAEKEKIEQNLGKNLKFEEDWQLSQFWYNDKTIKTLAGLVQKLKCDNPSFRCALLSCPSLYSAVKDVCENVHIYEFDPRFEAFGEDFVLYDFNEGDTPNYLEDRWNSYDLIIADPPFLSEECICKISKIIRNIQRQDAGKIVFCSGEVVEKWLQQYLDLKKCAFRPEHERNLGNEFVSYGNFNLDEFIDD